MKNDNADDTFEKVGDAEDEVVNVSGQPGPGSHMALRPRTITPAPPGGHLTPRTQVMSNAESGQRLGTRTERALSEAAGKLSIAETVDRASVSERGMLRHIFGLNLPGRDRA